MNKKEKLLESLSKKVSASAFDRFMVKVLESTFNVDEAAEIEGVSSKDYNEIMELKKNVNRLFGTVVNGTFVPDEKLMVAGYSKILKTTLNL